MGFTLATSQTGSDVSFQVIKTQNEKLESDNKNLKEELKKVGQKAQEYDTLKSIVGNLEAKMKTVAA